MFGLCLRSAILLQSTQRAAPRTGFPRVRVSRRIGRFARTGNKRIARKRVACLDASVPERCA